MRAAKKNTSSQQKKRPRKRKSLTLSPDEIETKVIELLEKADETIKDDYDLAQEYANRARKIQMRTRIKFPSEWKKRFCKHCKTFLYPGINCQIRLSSSNKIIAIKCLKCDRYTRIPYYKRKEAINEEFNR